jgi:hypothetical protein
VNNANVFPRYYKPRPYQAEAHRLFKTKRVSGLVFPRQSGKDVCASMEQVEARLKRPKTNGVYVAPNKPSIRNILYDKTYFDVDAGLQLQMLQDNVPTDQVKWKDAVMEGSFKNKSKLKLDGYFESGKETNGVGSSFDDYTFTELSLFQREDPIPRLMPIITQESGVPRRLMFVATPRGKRKNPLWQLMSSMEHDPNFGVLIRTIDDLNEIQARHGLPPVRSQAQLELDRENYLKRFGNDRMFMQEYYVSFEEMDAAAVYGEAYSTIFKERRDAPFNWDHSRPVYVAFDIGSSGVHSDATAWIAFQFYNEQLFLIDCGEGHGKALPEYVDVLQTKPWFRQISYVVLPWDGDHHEKAVNTTPADMLRDRLAGICPVAVLAKGTNIWTVKGLPNTGSADIITMVQQVRLQLYKTHINGLTEDEKKRRSQVTRPNCDRLLECFENYKYAYDTRKGEYSPFPVHDQYSHMMDALRYVVQAIKELGFFGGVLFGTRETKPATDYVQDYSEVW